METKAIWVISKRGREGGERKRERERETKRKKVLEDVSKLIVLEEKGRGGKEKEEEIFVDGLRYVNNVFFFSQIM